jgi:hypothetical protein
MQIHGDRLHPGYRGSIMIDATASRFIIRPITTVLQRVGRDDAHAWVLVEMADDNYLAFDLLREALAAWPGRRRKKVCFYVHLALPPGQSVELVDGEPSPQPVLFRQSRIVELAFQELARELGFRAASVEVELPSISQDWNWTTAEFDDSAKQDLAADESPVGDDFVDVYPVRTALSRFENSGADYVIHIRPPLNQFDTAMMERLPASIQSCLTQLRAEQPRRGAYLITDGRDNPVQSNAMWDLLGDARFWSDQLAFSSITLRQIG